MTDTDKLCGCWTCDDERRSHLTWHENFPRFIVCPDCGNKRCPKATHHDNACTDSNEPGQKGSRYE